LRGTDERGKDLRGLDTLCVEQFACVGLQVTKTMGHRNVIRQFAEGAECDFHSWERTSCLICEKGQLIRQLKRFHVGTTTHPNTLTA